MDIAKKITELREETGENRKEFSAHTGIPVRTLEDWEAGLIADLRQAMESFTGASTAQSQ